MPSTLQAELRDYQVEGFNWLARLAHSGEKVAQAARDEETLRLPAEIALFPERSLNRDLYLWLIAQGAALPADVDAFAAAWQRKG